MLKKLASLFGVIFLVIGVLGFVPAATTNGMLLGFFHVNLWHNIVHLLTGVIALSAGCGCCASCSICDKWTPKLFFQAFGVIYGLVAVLGFWYGNEAIFGWIANNTADTFLHVGVAVVSLYLGFVYKEE